MKKLLFLFFVLLSKPIWAFSQSDLIALLQKPQSVQGDFIQQRYLKSLAKPIESNGEFTLVAEKGLLWAMKKPFVSTMKVTPSGIFQWNGTAWVASDKLGQSQQIALFLGLLRGDISALKSQFDFAVEGEAQHWQLTLTPNSLLMKQIFTQIQLRGDELVQAIELNETQGDRTLILFSNQKINQATDFE